jgi:hypothetical protein
LEKIEAKVRGISIVITTKIMGEMLHLLVSRIHVPPTMPKDETHKFYLKFIDQRFWNEKEGGEFLVFWGNIYFEC